MAAENPLLSEEEMGVKGCGRGTENACFALTMGPGGFQCGLLSNPELASFAGIRLGWRVNVDASDGKAWCPKGVLGNSKKTE